MLDSSLFGRFVFLSPGVHNTAVTIGVLYILVLLCRIIHRLRRVFVNQKVLKEHGCLHLQGMSHYSKDISRLLRYHVAQILRIKRTVPSVICPRIVIVSSCLGKGFEVEHVYKEADVESIQLQGLTQEKDANFKFQFCSLPGVKTLALVVFKKTVEEVRELAFSVENLLHRYSTGANQQQFVDEIKDEFHAFDSLNPQPLEKLQPLIKRDSEVVLNTNDSVSGNSLIQAILRTENQQNYPYVFTNFLPSTDNVSTDAFVKITHKAFFDAASDADFNDVFLILIPTNKISVLASTPPWVTTYLGGVPVAETYAEVTHCKIMSQSHNSNSTSYFLVPVHSLHFARTKAAAAALVPSLYYATFQRYISSENADTAATQEDFLERRPRTRFAENEPFNILNINQRTLTRLSRFVNRLLRQHQRQSENQRRRTDLLFFEPHPVPPTPQQWKDLIRMQEDVELFGFGLGEDRECLICMSRGKEATLMPCRHSPCCSNCLKSLRQEKCPICRSSFSSYVIFPL